MLIVVVIIKTINRLHFYISVY